MTKSLKDLFEVYRPKAKDEADFVDKHVTIKHKDRNGNGDDVFKASNVKKSERKKERHGYEPGEDEKVYEETENLEEGMMKLSKVHIVHHHDHPAAKEFAKNYTAGMKGDHREGGPNAADDKAADKFHQRYTGIRTREGFAGSGTHIYTDRKTGAKWKVDRHPNGKTFYGTDHIISHHTGNVYESVEDEMYFTDDEDRVIRSLAGAAEELGEELDLETLAGLAEEVLSELSKDTLKSYMKKSVNSSADAWRDDKGNVVNFPSKSAMKTLSKRYKGQRSAEKKLANEEVEELDELSRKTLGNYTYKAASQVGEKGITAGLKIGDSEDSSKEFKTMGKRQRGIATAVKKLTKEDIINKAIETYIPEDVELPSLDERLVDKLDEQNIPEQHIHVLLSMFESLNEQNQMRVLERVETVEGINSLLDFAISNRGE